MSTGSEHSGSISNQGQYILEENNELQDIGMHIESHGVGLVLRNVFPELTILYIRVQNETCYCVLGKGMILCEASSLLKSLCEKYDLSLRRTPSWICQRKGIGRLRAVCSRSGMPDKSTSTGKRLIVSKKCGCTALVTKVPLSHCESEALKAEIEKSNLIVDKLSTFCNVHSVNMEHSGHLTQQSGTVVHKYINRYGDILTDSALRDQISTFLSIADHNDGLVLRLSSMLEETFPHIQVSDNALRNFVAHERRDQSDAQNLIKYMKKLQVEGDMEHLSYGTTSTGVLSFITWSFKGSRALAQSYCDLLFWDSTHNLTRYSYKFSTFTVVDCE